MRIKIPSKFSIFLRRKREEREIKRRKIRDIQRFINYLFEEYSTNHNKIHCSLTLYFDNMEDFKFVLNKIRSKGYDIVYYCKKYDTLTYSTREELWDEVDNNIRKYDSGYVILTKKGEKIK